MSGAIHSDFSFETVHGWSIERVKQWAIEEVRVKAEYADILVTQEIDGAALLDVVTRPDLMAVGMPLGSAGKIMLAVAAIKRAGGIVGGAGAPTDSRAGACAPPCGCVCVRALGVGNEG